MRKFKHLIIITFLIYCTMLLWLLLIGRFFTDTYQTRVIEFIPFGTIRTFINAILYSDNPNLVKLSYANIVGNILLFVPMGVFLPAIFKSFRKFGSFFLCMFLLVADIESIQYLAKLGSCDVDDLFLNIIGALIGFLIFKIIYKNYFAIKKV